MRARITYVAGLTIAIAGLAVGIVSCSDRPTGLSVSPEATSSQTQSLEALRASYRWAGDYHTDAVVYVHARLKQANALAAPSGERCRIATAAFADFNRGYRRNGAPLSVGTVPANICSPAVTESHVSSFGSGEDGPQAGSGVRLSPQARKLLSDMMTAMQTKRTLPQLRNAVGAIESSATATLSASEAAAIVSAGRLTLSSAEYWTAHQEAWRPAHVAATHGTPAAATSPGLTASIGTMPDVLYSTSSGDGILEADVKAFISTLLATFWTGVVSIEAAAFTAAMASLGAAIMNLM